MSETVQEIAKAIKEKETISKEIESKLINNCFNGISSIIKVETTNQKEIRFLDNLIKINIPINYNQNEISRLEKEFQMENNLSSFEYNFLNHISKQISKDLTKSILFGCGYNKFNNLPVFDGIMKTFGLIDPSTITITLFEELSNVSLKYTGFNYNPSGININFNIAFLIRKNK